MTSQQIDAAMRSRAPVLWNGRRYLRIQEFISWYDERGKRRLSAVLLESNGKVTIRVPAEQVEPDAEMGGSNGT